MQRKTVLNPGGLRLPALLCASALGSSMLWSTFAVAAQKATSDSVGLEEVVVTAQFRAENLQATPLAITAVSGEQLDQQGLTNVAELGYVIPNANIRPNPGAGPNASIGMRGVNTSEFIYTTEPGVAVYVDDVYHGTLTGSAMDLLDLDRVEVLRGPQGTLFGKNALGGAIRLISKEAKGDNTGYVEATYGTSRRMDLKAGFDFALADNLFMRVTGVSKHIDGYGETLDYACQMKKNGTPALAGKLPVLAPSNFTTAGDCSTGQTGGSESQAMKAMVRYLPSSDLEFNLSADYSHTVAQPGVQTLLRGIQSTGLDQVYNNVYVQPTWGIRYDNNNFVTNNPFTSYQSFTDLATGTTLPRDQLTNTWSSTAKVDYTLNDSIHFKFVAAHRGYWSDWATVPFSEFAGVGTTYNLQSHAQNSAELQVSGSLFDKRVEWTTGAFYFDSKSALGGHVWFGYLTYFGIIPDFDQNDHFTTKSKSGFAHAVWKVTDAFTLTGGVRETNEDKTYQFDHTNYLTIPKPLLFGNSHFDWKVNADYKINDNAMIYAMASTGFRSDGAQPRPWAPNQLLPVAMEEITAYEIGAKTDWFDRRLRANLSVFMNDYDPRVQNEFGYSCSPTGTDPGPFVPFGTPACPAGTQLAGKPPGSGGVFWFYYFSAPGKATGAELEITAEPVRNLNINASAAFYNYSSSVAKTAAGYEDPSTREQPRFTLSLGAQYAFGLGDNGSLTPRIDWFYQTERTNGGFINLPETPDTTIPGYAMVNARVTYATNDGKWTAALSADNLFNKFYWYQLAPNSTNNGLNSPVYNRTGAPGRPREIALTVHRKL
jgi:iron complex outermembrane recepter protein